ncbi:hypothetical protein ACIA5E_18275 [Nocardia asteroides]|uniref:hypothetical protein n=1 Tax=Nocardia asteroides TaxID=1824 RepID=UPI0037A6B760
MLVTVQEPFVDGRPASDAAAFGVIEGALLGGGFGGAAGATVCVCGTMLRGIEVNEIGVAAEETCRW